MVFPSLPIYLDPPNWSQQQPTQQPRIGNQNPQIPPPPQQSSPLTVATAIGGGGHQGSIRPGSMADRARLAKIHNPDASLKCPRCESTNTKFCYYNNYSLSQPRHFCKTCRRYWTRGGALRNVPVGGGCRRNKRSKGSNNNARSKSPMKPSTNGGSTSANSSSSCTTDHVMMGHLQTPITPTTQFPFLASLHHYSGDHFPGGISSHFGPIIPTSLAARNGNSTDGGNNDVVEFQIGTSNSSLSLGNGGGGGSMLSNGHGEQWRLSSVQHHHHHQFPFLSTNLEPQIGVFQFGGENNNNNAEAPRDAGRFVRSKMDSVSGIMPIKLEENFHGLPKNLLMMSGSGNDVFWNANGNAWSEQVPSFTTTPPSHLL
ncbi:hypothetical protein RJT34_18623 [Clitoria ternatea]|uniref:Dof zinc finger protein n=1 Tax=Clitoria ternatea TaxID=43366 RepID=A0AAN9PG17_CLITE